MKTWDAVLREQPDAADGQTGRYRLRAGRGRYHTSPAGKQSCRVPFTTVGQPARTEIVHDFWLNPENPAATAVFFRDARLFGLDTDFFIRFDTIEEGLDAMGEAIDGREIDATVRDGAVKQFHC